MTTTDKNSQGETAPIPPPVDLSSGGADAVPSAELLARLANDLFSACSHGAYLAPGETATADSAPAARFPMTLPDNVSYPAATTGGPPKPWTMPTDAVEAYVAPLQMPLATPQESKPNNDDAPLRSGPGYYFLQSVQPTAGSAILTNLPTLAIRPELQGASCSAWGTFDVQAIRRDFPILREQLNGRQLIWLDNGATTQKPQVVIDRLTHFYQHENSNIHRAAHALAARATDAYEKARDTVSHFINASSSREIVFVRGGTEAINLVAQSWGRQNIRAGDEIVITWLEHHANIVPWQQLAAEKGAVLRVVPVDDHGQLMLDEYQKLLGPKTRLVAFPQVSNALGTVTPAKKIVAMARRHGARVLIDAAQSIAHSRTDVQALDCDWLVFSGHKMFGPTGIGVLYGREELLNSTLPWQGGGNMIQDVTFERTTYRQAPVRFEAGTGNIADAIGLGAAIDYIHSVGIDNIARYEHELLQYATTALARVPGLHLIGTAPEKAAVLSFVLDGLHTEDIGQALSQSEIAVRAGHHCAQPILRRFGLESTVRASLAMYNTFSEIDALVTALQRITSSSPAPSPPKAFRFA